MQSQNVSDSRDQRSESSSLDNLSEYFRVIRKYRKFIGYVVGVIFVLSIIVSLLLPKLYEATCRILPPRENEDGLVSLLSEMDDPLGGLAGRLMGSQTPAALYVGILKSRSVADVLNQKFKLKELYGLKYIEDVYRKLEDRATIEISKQDQLIYVSVRDRDPQRAADMANTYVEMLDRLNRRLNITQGKRKRIFLEGRLKEVRADLEQAETDLKAFQEKHHVVAIDEQAKAAIEGAAEIKAQIITAQTELEVFKQSGTEKQIEAVMLRTKIEELERQLDAISQGQKTKSGDTGPGVMKKGSDFYIPINELPSVGLQLMRLSRKAKIQEKLFELLVAQYEMAQIDEAKDVDTIQLIDKAVPAEKKSSPRRFAIVVSSVMISAMISVFLAYLIEFAGWEQALKARWQNTADYAASIILKLRTRK